MKQLLQACFSLSTVVQQGIMTKSEHESMQMMQLGRSKSMASSITTLSTTATIGELELELDEPMWPTKSCSFCITSLWLRLCVCTLCFSNSKA